MFVPNVEQGATVLQRCAGFLQLPDAEYVHNVIDHAEGYVRGNIHTKGIEDFWSLLNRSLGRTYISVEPFHLFRYLESKSSRFNNRKSTDSERFLKS